MARAAGHMIGAAEAARQRLDDFHQNPVPMLLVDPATRTLVAGNAAACALFGYEADDLRGLSTRALRPASEHERLDIVCAARRQRPERLEGNGPHGSWLYRRRDGSTFYADVLRSTVEIAHASDLLLIQIRDVTAWVEAESVLIYREQVLDAVAHAAECLLAAPDWQTCLPDVFNRLGSATGAARLYLYRFTAPDAPLAELVHDWASGNRPSLSLDPALRKVDLERVGMARWLAAFRSREGVGGLVQTFPRDEAAFLESRGVRVLMAVPVFVDDELWGFMGCDQGDHGRPWTASEMDGLRVAADTMGAAIRRSIYEARHRQAERDYRALMEAASDAIFIADIDSGQLLLANDRAAELTGRTLDDLLGRHHTLLHPPEERDRAARLFAHRALRPEAPAIASNDLSLLAADGQRVPVSITSSVVALGKRRVLQAICRDITAAKRYEAELIAARHHAEEMSMLKSVFLANMSHEIRTPLTSIMGFAALLEASTEGEQREAAALIHSSAERLNETLSAVLDLAQLESGSVSLGRLPVELAEVAESALLAVRRAARAKGLELHIVREGTEATATADRAAVARIMAALLSNAIKFTDRGEVVVRVFGDASGAGFEVRDTGIGISEEFLPYVFDEFRQESAGIARTHEGNGLGLPITRRLVELMGGTLTVASRKGCGSSFTVRFPAGVASELATAASALSSTG
jgi:PAS domain S-box-containing protein